MLVASLSQRSGSRSSSSLSASACAKQLSGSSSLPNPIAGACGWSPRARRRSARRSRTAKNAWRSSASAKPVRSAVNSAGRVVSLGNAPARRCGPASAPLSSRQPRLAVERAEGHRQHCALLQRLRPGVTDYRPARRVERDLSGAGLLACAVGQPENAAAVATLERTGQQQPHRGAFEQRRQRTSPRACRVVGAEFVGFGRRVGIGVGKGREVVYLVDHEQRVMPVEFAQVQIGRGGDALISSDVAGETATGIRCVIGGAERECMAEFRAPGWIGKRLFSLLPQAVARHYPADLVDEPSPDQACGGNHWQQRLATTGRYRCEDVARVGLARCDCLDQAEQLPLVGAERASGQASILAEIMRTSLTSSRRKRRDFLSSGQGRPGRFARANASQMSGHPQQLPPERHAARR